MIIMYIYALYLTYLSKANKKIIKLSDQNTLFIE